MEGEGMPYSFGIMRLQRMAAVTARSPCFRAGKL
jgi:hypothetical protein